MTSNGILCELDLHWMSFGIFDVFMNTIYDMEKMGQSYVHV